VEGGGGNLRFFVGVDDSTMILYFQVFQRELIKITKRRKYM